MHSHDHSHHHEPSDASVTIDESQAVCVVTGDVVNKSEAEEQGLVRTHGDQTYYFCCQTCVKLFGANPDTYANKLH